MKSLRKQIAALILLCILSIGAVGVGTTAFPRAARAQTVPIGTMFDFNNIMQHLKDFVLDHLAVLIAKQILHQMTLSIINWINSGYKGSPGFISNPSQFFENAADQVTGAFISTDGTLSKLCSPFSVNIRVALALQQSQFTNQKYACTLGSIINNASNANITVNGTSINGFMNGNFSQGGWPAFIALTTEPQNNPYSAYLESASDLRTQIALRQGALNFDLQLGQGFLSWNSCSDVTAQMTTYAQATPNADGTSDAFNEAYNTTLTNNGNGLLKSGTNLTAIANGQDQFGNMKSIQETTDPKTGAVSYQDCTVQTPGSAVASQLFTSINSPQVEAELANDMNAVINAAISQMVTQMLKSGLGALSGGGSTSYTQQALNSVLAQTQSGVKSSQTQASTYLTTTSSTTLANEKTTYDTAVAAVTVTQNVFQSARQCFTSLLASNSLNPYQTGVAQSAIASLDAYVETNVTPVYNNISAKDAALGGIASSTYAATAAIGANNPASTDQLQTQLPTYISGVQTSITANTTAATGEQAAQTDLKNTQTAMQTAGGIAMQYTQTCRAIPATLVPPGYNTGSQFPQ